jgi:hypothetical protein
MVSGANLDERSWTLSPPPPALRATSPVEGEGGGELGALPPLNGEGPTEGRGWGDLWREG